MGDSTLIEGYVAQLRAILPTGPLVRRRIVAEMSAHLLDATEHHVEQGLGREEAERRAIHEFGPPELIAGSFPTPWSSRMLASVKAGNPKRITVAGAIAALAVTGASIASGGGQTPFAQKHVGVTAPLVGRAQEAARALMTHGQLTEFEHEIDNGGTYEVEFATRAGEAELRLDRGFHMLGKEGAATPDEVRQARAAAHQLGQLHDISKVEREQEDGVGYEVDLVMKDGETQVLLSGNLKFISAEQEKA